MAENTEVVSPGCRLRECRKAAHLTLDQMASRVNEIKNWGGPCTASNLSGIENGQRSFSGKYAILFGKVLNVAPAYLLGQQEEKNPGISFSLDEFLEILCALNQYRDTVENHFIALAPSCYHERTDRLEKELSLVESLQKKIYSCICNYKEE